METFIKHKTIHWDEEASTPLDQHLICEEPLWVKIQNKPHIVLMRTPGNETSHIAGFFLTEGIIDTPDDLMSISFGDDNNNNIVAVRLKPSKQNRLSRSSAMHGFSTPSAYTGSSEEMEIDFPPFVYPMTDETSVDIKEALFRLEKLSEHQPLRQATGAAHAAVIYSSDFELLSVAEDVARHNALDKAIGKLFLERSLDQASFLTMSSRLSYELIKKAGRARIPIIFSVSRPTARAVSLATHLNMTIACLARKSGLYIFCGTHRLKK